MLIGAALVAAGAGLAAGVVAACAVVPLGLWIGLLARRAEGADAGPARQLLAAGLLALPLGAAVSAASLWSGLAIAGVGLVVARIGLQRALEVVPLRSDLGLPSGRRGLKLSSALVADELMLASWQARGQLRPQGRPAEVATLLNAAAARNREEGWLEDPAGAHPPPPALEKPWSSGIHLRGLGAVEHLRFESEYEARDPEIADAYGAIEPNRIAHAYLWRHADGPRPTLICVHGYGGGRVGMDARVFGVPDLHDHLGLDVALMVLPLHGPRAAGRRSGKGFFDGPALFPNAALGQAVWDLRRLAGYLRGEGAPLVGVHGMSLGGYTTALLASLDGRLACAVPGIPAVSLSDIIWSALGPRRQTEYRAAGVSPALWDEAFATHAPLRHRPRVASRGRLILAGAADRICPPEQALALQDHWGGTPIHWFPGTHLGPIGRTPTRQRLDDHLRATLLSPPPQDLPLTRFRT